MRSSLNLILCLYLIWILPASAESFRPGVYQWGGDAYLSIDPADHHGEQGFGISIEGANARFCKLKGRIKNNDAWLTFKDGNRTNKCNIGFYAESIDKIGVSTVQRDYGYNCMHFCGHKSAGFDDIYTIPPKACRSTQLIREKQAFKAQYMSGDYSKAIQTLEGLRENCKMWMTFRDDINTRNDLAVAYSHIKSLEKCIDTLAPFWQTNLAQTSKGIQQNSDSDSELALEIAAGHTKHLKWALTAVSAARTNLKRCGYKFPSK